MRTASCLLLSLALTTVTARAADPEPVAAHPPTDPLQTLALLGIPVTEGAAPGYVPDRTCGMCHSDRFASFQEVGMARSFYRPRADRFVEPFDATYYDETADLHYQMLRRGDDLVFRSYQEDATGEPILELEIEVDWILGSGHRSRVYLYQTPSGELFQLPLAWYADPSRWGLAPGFERPTISGVDRPVGRACMFCHDAYPEIPAGSDEHRDAQVFPEDLPEGIGCQRCHGPGARHVGLVLLHAEPEKAREAIFNPARLPFARRHEVCYQCHLQPSVTLFGIRRFDRGDLSFRPWESLSDYLVHVDPVESNLPREERFEINHHAYRMRQSLCFVASQGALGCLTCHDPHRKVPEAEREGHYRQACLTCHQQDDCSRPTPEGASEGEGPEHTAAMGGDCVSCHMPRRRTQDVIEVVMTDHRIQRRPPPEAERLAPLAPHEPEIEDVELLDPASVSDPELEDLYRAVTLLRAVPNAEAAARLERLAADGLPTTTDPTLLYDLAKARFDQGKPEATERALDEADAKFGPRPFSRELRALAAERAGDKERAIGILRALVEDDPRRPTSQYQLARLLLPESPEDAKPHLEEAVRLRPNLAPGWLLLAEARWRTDDREAAVAAGREALALDPRLTRGYLDLAGYLTGLERPEEARRFLIHGSQHAADPRPILERLMAGG